MVFAVGGCDCAEDLLESAEEGAGRIGQAVISKGLDPGDILGGCYV